MIGSLLTCLLLAGQEEAVQPGVPEKSSSTAPAELPKAGDEKHKEPAVRFVLEPVAFVRVNPLALEARLAAGYKRRLYESDNPLFKDNHVFFAVNPMINPAFGVAGGFVELKPASFFVVKVSGYHWGYFGSFGMLQSFRSPTDDFSDSAMSANTQQQLNYRTVGFRLAIEPTVQLAFAGVAVRYRPTFELYGMTVRPGDRYWYNSLNDTLTAHDGWVMTHEVDLLYVGWPKWLVGLNFASITPLYKGDDGQHQRLNSQMRLGPLVGYTFYDDGYTRFDRPTVFVMLEWFLTHRYRTGADVHRAVPYVLLGFAATSDLL
jgi:hypothetical protein